MENVLGLILKRCFCCFTNSAICITYIQCAVHTVQFAVHTVQSAVHTVQCQFNVQYIGIGTTCQPYKAEIVGRRL